MKHAVKFVMMEFVVAECDEVMDFRRDGLRLL